MPLPSFLQPRQITGEQPVHLNGVPLTNIGNNPYGSTTTFVPGGRHCMMAIATRPMPAPGTKTRDPFRKSKTTPQQRNTTTSVEPKDADEITLNETNPFDDDDEADAKTLVNVPTSNSSALPSDAPESSEDEEDPADLVRPSTPDQGDNHNPWRSYSDLRPSHPVFHYPDSVREKFYAKGVDPVERAEMDYVRLGKVYGEKKSGTRTGLYLSRRFGG